MSQRVNTGIVVVAGFLLALAAGYWFRGWRDKAQPAAASASAAAPAEIKRSARISEPPASEPATNSIKKAAAEPNAGVSLRTGEVLDYTADVAKVPNVANLRVKVAERRNFGGKSAWHLQAFAHTQNPLRMVIELDDQFDSYSDAASLTTLQYEMHLHERGQKVDSVQRMTTTGRDPATANASETRVLPGTRDPLSLLQYLRTVDWIKTHEVRSPIYDGHKLYDVRATPVGSEKVSVPAGNFDAKKVDIQVFDNGQEMKDAHVVLYLAENEAHTPVLLEAVMPFATARVGLKSSK